MPKTPFDAYRTWYVDGKTDLHELRRIGFEQQAAVKGSWDTWHGGLACVFPFRGSFPFIIPCKLIHEK